MKRAKNELFVLVIQGNEVSFGMYTVNRKIPQLLSYKEQQFPDDVFQQGFLFNLPLFVEKLRNFLSPHTQSTPTIICLNYEGTKEGIYQKQEPFDDAKKMTFKIQTLGLPLCCYATPHIYVRQVAYSLLIQYTLLFELLDRPLLSIISPLTSLIYFNHQYAGAQHQLTDDTLEQIVSFLETRCLALLRNKLIKPKDNTNQTLLSLYSLTTAYVGANRI